MIPRIPNTKAAGIERFIINPTSKGIDRIASARAKYDTRTGGQDCYDK